MNSAQSELTAKQPGLFVIGSGLATSALSLFLVFLIEAVTENFHPMGFYLAYVLPVGAIAVGGIAGSGYGIASWISSVKISNKLLWTVIGLQIGTYFVAQYIEYLSLAPQGTGGSLSGFLRYFDFTARSFAWTQDDGSAGEALGIWGYAFRLLEVGGFAIGGLIAPAILSNKPYCENCQVYMKSSNLCLIPAGVKPRKIKKKNVEEQAAYEAEIDAEIEKGDKVLSQLQSFSENDQAEEFKQLVAVLGEQKKEAAKLTTRISVDLAFCKRCHEGFLSPSMVAGQGEETVSTPLGEIHLNAKFVRQIIS